MKDLLETMQKVLPWAASLPFAPKILITVIIIALAVLFLILLWIPPRQQPISKRELGAEDARLQIADLVVGNARSLNPILDIKLLNVGNKTAFLTRLSLNVLERRPYLALVKPSANYDLLIEAERNELHVAHEIPPNGTDRIVIRLGASRQNLACYFILQLELTYNRDKSLLSNPFEVEFLEQH